MSLVELSHVVKRFGTNTVLDDVSLKVVPGEIIAVIGRSGSGKSTMLRCINGLEPIQDGRILFDGVTVNDPQTDLRALRQRVGIVFQSYNLFPHLSVEKNITLAPRVVKQMPESEARALARESCRRSGSRRRSRPTPISSPAASSSGSRSRARLPCARSSCSSTRSPRRSIPSSPARC